MAVKIKQEPKKLKPGEEYPTVEKTGSSTHDSTETHPAYGQIAASRVSSNPGGVLYGSDFRHQHYMTITIRRSEMHRGLMSDWPSARDELIEVALSESQWATFVSTPNSGFGVPCTIQHIDRKSMPRIPCPPERDKQFTEEAIEAFQSHIRDMEKLMEKIDGTNMPAKVKEKLLHDLHVMRSNLVPNVKFASDQYGRHMEKVKEQAKTEINAYITNAIHRAGVQALVDKGIPLSLPDKKEKNNED